MSRSVVRRTIPLALVAGLVAGLAACGGSSAASDTAGPAADGTTTVVIAQQAGAPYTATSVTVPTVTEIRAKLPTGIRDSGTLKIGIGALPVGFPPLASIGTDQKTLTGSEPDLGRLVAAVLGLKPELFNATWENMFVGFDSGRTDVGFSNITDTEERKQKYDFASYRKDELAFEVKADNPWTFTGDHQALAGKNIAVSRGTNQEKLLLEWQKKLKVEGKELRITYFPTYDAATLAIVSGKIDGYLGPNPTAAHHVALVAGTPTATRIAGTYSGAGSTLQGLIAATVKKDDGLVRPVADAITYLIENGQYGKLLAAYGIQAEAVKTSEVNPPGLPLDNS